MQIAKIVPRRNSLIMFVSWKRCICYIFEGDMKRMSKILKLIKLILRHDRVFIITPSFFPDSNKRISLTCNIFKF